MEYVLFFVSLCLIWAAWGIWALVWTLIGKLVFRLIFKPESTYDVNWGGIIANLIIYMMAVGAVNAIWHEPVYNAAMIVIIVMIYAIELKS